MKFFLKKSVLLLLMMIHPILSQKFAPTNIWGTWPETHLTVAVIKSLLDFNSHVRKCAKCALKLTYMVLLWHSLLKDIQMISFGLIMWLLIILKSIYEFFQERDNCRKTLLEFVPLLSHFCDSFECALFGIIFMMTIHHNILHGLI